MAVKACTFHIAVCDVTGCGREFDEAGDYWGWDDTPELALAQVDKNPDWTRYPDGRVICPASDTAHYLARGGESPTLLKPSPDAMAACFPAA